MANLTALALLAIIIVNTVACQIPYLARNGYRQVQLLASGEPIEEVLNQENIDPEKKRKLRLAQQARTFASQELGLNADRNYQKFVDLKRPYVTYVVSASDTWDLKPLLWWFPIIGNVPYKGFFTEEEAREEALDLKKAEKWDVTYRGVSAYSTLGWFRDPLLSSMLRYRDIDLVETIIHESVHATFYISSNADFNERAAVFVGTEGASSFYRSLEGENSVTLAEARDRAKDEMLFSRFLGEELKSLQAWYRDHPQSDAIGANQKNERIAAIQKKFTQEIAPQMKTNSFSEFGKRQLNNADLLLLKTYNQDLELFHRLYIHFNSDLRAFIGYCGGLKHQSDPEKAVLAFLEGSK